MYELSYDIHLYAITLTQITVTLSVFYTFLLTGNRIDHVLHILHVSYCDDDPSPDWDFDLARLGQYCS